MVAWLIFKNSIWFIYNNFGSAVRISMLPYAIWFFVSVSLVETGSFEQSLWRLLIQLPLVLITGAWIAVGWHRFILLGEYPNSWFPVFQWSRILAYIWRLVLLILLVFISAIPLVLLVSVFSGSASILMTLWLSFFVFLLGLLIYRLGLVLPAISVGTPLSLKRAWRETSRINGAILVTIILSSILSRVIQGIGDNIPSVSVNYVWSFAAGWIETMLAISILTTLYGVLIEKRELA